MPKDHTKIAAILIIIAVVGMVAGAGYFLFKTISAAGPHPSFQ